MAELLEVAGLTKHFAGLTAVDDLSFTVGAGEIISIIGPNGAGKSTALAMVAGATRPSSGTVSLDGHELPASRPHISARSGIARTHQIPRPFGALTVEQNLRVARRYGGNAEVSVTGILEFCGLESAADRTPLELGHSTLRRLEVARALATDPRVLLLDEVGAGLTANELKHLSGLVKQVAEREVGIVLVEHNIEFVVATASRAIVMDGGREIARGAPADVTRDPRVVEAYLGKW